MPAVGQTSYAFDSAVATAGQIADYNGMQDTQSYAAHGAISFGTWVRERSDGTIENPTDDTGVIVGITVRQDLLMGGYPYVPSAPVAPVAAGMAVTVLKKGRIWMPVSSGASGTGTASSAVLGTPANIDEATANCVGFVTDAATSANSVRAAVGHARFVDRAASKAVTTVDPLGNTLALVEINLP